MFSTAICRSALLARSKANRAFSAAANISRQYSTPRQVPGVLLDIDGVFVLGKRAIVGTREALIKLKKNNIPFVFLTNGGGCSEHEKISELEKKLELPRGLLDNSQMILAHTPLAYLPETRQFMEDRVLIVGGEKCEAVAKSYGFNHAISVQNFVARHPSLYPFSPQYLKKTSSGGTETLRAEKKFKAIFVMHDSINLGEDVQVMVDVLRSNGLPGVALSESEQDVKLFFCNPDLLYASEFPWPRFGQGVLKTSICAAYSEIKRELENRTDARLHFTQMGKPEAIQYNFAKSHLLTVAKNLFGVNSIDRFYGVGDNPMADIRGANRNGCHSILVRTGVFVGEKQDPRLYHDHTALAQTICDDVVEFVDKLVAGEV